MLDEVVRGQSESCRQYSDEQSNFSDIKRYPAIRISNWTFYGSIYNQRRSENSGNRIDKWIKRARGKWQNCKCLMIRLNCIVTRKGKHLIIVNIRLNWCTDNVSRMFGSVSTVTVSNNLANERAEYLRYKIGQIVLNSFTKQGLSVKRQKEAVD